MSFCMPAADKLQPPVSSPRFLGIVALEAEHETLMRMRSINNSCALCILDAASESLKGDAYAVYVLRGWS